MNLVLRTRFKIRIEFEPTQIIIYGAYLNDILTLYFVKVFEKQISQLNMSEIFLCEIQVAYYRNNI